MIPNIAGVDLPSPNLELMRTLSPALWVELERTGYQVTMPDILGKSGAPEITARKIEDIAWFIEVEQDKAIAYMYQVTEAVYLGPKYHIHGTPDVTVAEAKRLLELTAQEEVLSGVQERNVNAEIENVYLH